MPRTEIIFYDTLKCRAADINMNTHTRTHARAHTHTHTHTNIQIHTFNNSFAV